MRITWLPDAAPRPRHIAVGEFDGVHLGHREVIRGADTVLTFEPHPRVIVGVQPAPKLLTSLAAKADLVAELGVEELVVIPFDEAFSKQTASEFIDRVLVGRLGAETVSVGENFRFGNKARGDVGLLAADDRFDTRAVALVEVEGRVVTSTYIRELIAAGDVEQAASLLGSRFQLRSAVAHGDKRGRTLGYPTANLVPDDAFVCPGNGVYASRAGIEEDGTWRWRAAATSVGVRPTFGAGLGVLVEVFLLDYEGDLYERELRVEFVERLRGEERFDSIDALLEQMALDVEATRARFA